MSWSLGQKIAERIDRMNREDDRQHVATEIAPDNEIHSERPSAPAGGCTGPPAPPLRVCSKCGTRTECYTRPGQLRWRCRACWPRWPVWPPERVGRAAKPPPLDDDDPQCTCDAEERPWQDCEYHNNL